VPKISAPAWLNFGPLTDALDKLKSGRRDLRGKLEVAKQRREELERSPASRADMANAYDAVVDRMAADYRQRLAAEVERFASHPLHIDQLAGDVHPLGKTLPLSIDWQNRRWPDKVDPAAIAYFMPDLLKDGMRRAIEQLPLGEKMNLAARRKEIASIDEQIVSTEKELDQLEETARSAGIRFRTGD
jgi:hypothetical protein